MADFESFYQAKERIAEDTKRWKDMVAKERGPDEDQYLTKEIAELEEPLQNVLEQLRPQIESGEFSLIIGDDGSGRVPALALARVLKHRYEENKQEQPKILFFAGSGSLAMREKGDLIDENLVDIKTEVMAGELANHQTKGKALIVTEAIVTGHGLRALTSALQLAEIPYEIAAVGLAKYGTTTKEPEKRIEMSPEELAVAKARREAVMDAPVHVGIGKTPSIYPDTILAGVVKDPHDIYATRAAPHSETMDIAGDSIKLQRVVNESRKDIEILAEHLIKKYEKTA